MHPLEEEAWVVTALAMERDVVTQGASLRICGAQVAFRGTYYPELRTWSPSKFLLCRVYDMLDDVIE